MAQVYSYRYNHPVSNYPVEFTSFEPGLTFGVWVEGVMAHFQGSEAAIAYAASFTGRNVYIVPIETV